MRKIKIRFLGPIRRPTSVDASVPIDVEAGETVESLLERLGYDRRERSRIQILMGGQAVNSSQIVEEIDELTLFLPLGGG